MGRERTMLVGVAAVALALAGCGTPRATTASTTTTAATNGTTTTASTTQAACSFILDPSISVLTQPAANAHVTSPFTVSGNINAFEATFQIVLQEPFGTDIQPVQTGHSATGQVQSPFSTMVSFSPPNSPMPACLLIFQFSAQNSSRSMITQVPITLMP